MTSLRLNGVVIDVPQADHTRAIAFWAAALGRNPIVNDKHPEYAQFADVAPECYLLVQSTGEAASRIHLDFAVTDRDREIDRLVAAGAEEVTREHLWAVLRDPAGHPFCLCPVAGCT